MSEELRPETAAIRVLQSAGVPFSDHYYAYKEGGHTAACAQELKIDEHAVVKAIVLEADGKPVIVLMHGDMRASAKELAKIAGVQAIKPCPPERTEEFTGYAVGGVSPFATRTEMPIYMEETILNLRKIYVNGGRQGYFVSMDPYDLVKILHPVMVKIGSARAS
ncbi:MAG: aminoacyl-tRNA deacylase [Thermodesulfovibrionales bacterium]